MKAVFDIGEANTKNIAAKNKVKQLWEYVPAMMEHKPVKSA